MGRIFLFTKIPVNHTEIPGKSAILENFKSHFAGTKAAVIFAVRFERKGLILEELGQRQEIGGMG